jgi:hypothetical protein
VTVPGRGGLPPRRPDQVYAPPAPAVPPGSAAGVFFGRLVVITSGGVLSGLFIYSGPPGPSNPPVLSAVAPGVTKDPYGNPVSSVLNIGNQSGAHTGFDAAGIEYLSDTSGDIRITIDPTRQLIGFYGAPGLFNGGPLQMSIASSAGTDQDANAFLAGLEMFSGGFPITITDPAVINFISAGTSTGSIKSLTGSQRLSVAGPQGISLPCAGNNVIMDSFSFIAAGSDSTGTVPAPWQNITTTLLNGWTGTFSWRHGAENEIKFKCSMVPGADTDLTIITNLFGVTLPSGPQTHAVWCNALRTGAVGAATEGAALRLDATGNVRCLGIAAAATEVSGCGFWPLDV